MKIWLKLVIAGIIICVVGALIMQGYGLTTDTGLIAMMVGAIGLAMAMIGVIVGLRRGFRRMMNE